MNSSRGNTKAGENQGSLQLNELAEGDVIASEQQKSLISGNGIQGIVSESQGSDSVSNFHLVPDQGQVSKTVPGLKQSSSPKVSGNKSNENRAMLRSANDANIDALNSIVSNNTSVRQRSRAIQQNQSQQSVNGLIVNSNGNQPIEGNESTINFGFSDRTMIGQESRFGVQPGGGFGGGQFGGGGMGAVPRRPDSSSRVLLGVEVERFHADDQKNAPVPNVQPAQPVNPLFEQQLARAAQHGVLGVDWVWGA